MIFDDDIYLVNETGNTIESVIANTGGFQTLDDDMFSISGPYIEYKKIVNNDAVKVEEYDKLRDSDYVLEISIKVKLNGKWIDLKKPTAKGGFKEEVLLWD